MSAAGKIDSGKLARELVTPEGVDLRIVLADAGERISAFLLDVLFIVLMLVALTLGMLGAALATGFVAAEFFGIIWILGFFFLRVFYFTAFEVTPRAATWGKRIVGIRVASRDGGALTADAIFARNAMRELELFLPLSFLVAQKEVVDAWIYLLATVWCGVFVLFPLFNRDRLRIGDIVAGTWVVRVPKRLLGRDLLDRPESSQLTFTKEQVDAYGIKELSVLEDVLRHGHAETIHAVAGRIRHKIGMAHDRSLDGEFLQAYYKALRARLETRMLFGRRKADKFDKTP
ncbi:MAG: RDD family protein [Alphaproteobacteria bacterium]|nr:RDD family protein [Alphaproteobacteria bacterium]MBL7097722.1 RDD family protein [Alphaproteobacteria bacterium]